MKQRAQKSGKSKKKTFPTVNQEKLEYAGEGGHGGQKRKVTKIKKSH